MTDKKKYQEEYYRKNKTKCDARTYRNRDKQKVKQYTKKLKDLGYDVVKSTLAPVSLDEQSESTVCPNCGDRLMNQLNSTNKNCVTCGETVKTGN